MALIYGQLVKAQLENLAADPTGVTGLVYFNTATLFPKVYNGTVWKTLADIDSAQVITNKDIDGGTASSTSRITIPKDTKANLDALTRKEATLVYASDLDKLYADDGSTLKEIGSGGSGINYLADYFTADTIGTVGTGNVSDTGNRTTGAIMAAWQSTNTTNINLTVSSSSPLRSPNCFLFTSGGTPASATGATFIESPAFQLHVADLGKPVMVSFDLGDVTADGNFDVCMVRYDSGGNFVERISIAGNASGATPASAKLPLGVTKFNGFFVASSTSTDYYALRIRRLAGTDVPRMDSIKVSPDSVVQGAAVTDWVSFTPSISTATLSLDVSVGWYRRVGDSMEVTVNMNSSGSGSGGSIVVAVPGGYTADTSKYSSASAIGTQLGAGQWYDHSGTDMIPITVVLSGTTSIVMHSQNAGNWDIIDGADIAVSDAISFFCTIPIVGWSSNVTMANRAVERYFYTSESFDAAGSTTVEGIDGQATTDLTTSRVKTLTIPNLQPTDRVALELRFQDSSAWFDASQLAPILLSVTGTNLAGCYVYTATTTTVAITFAGSKWAAPDGAPTTGWGTNLRWRVRVTSGGGVVGYPVSSENLVVPHSDVGTIGYTSSAVSSGSYTATATASTNVDAVGSFEAQYIRVGKVVTVSGVVNIDPAASGATTVTMLVPSGMPISADTTVPVGGVATNKSTSVDVMGIDKASATEVAIRGNPTTRTNATYTFTFTYRMD